MITRICISINNRCNLNCSYCHFHEKSDHIQEREMDVFKILDNVKAHISRYDPSEFKIGFVGNGEPLLDFDKLKNYITYISEELASGTISAYTITNGTIIDEEKLRFFKKHKINVGFSIDGLPHIHNKLRCNSYEKVMSAITLYREIFGCYPSMNCTVGRDVLENSDKTIAFFKRFDNRITFSRMIGKNGITMRDFQRFIEQAKQSLNVRTGGYDCTMYGGKCGAGINNLFFANGYVYICGNCIDLGSKIPADTPLDQIDESSFDIKPFDRNICYKEGLK